MTSHKISTLLFGLCTTLSLSTFAAGDPLVGTWKTIDDRTGYSLSDVVIRKDKDNHYSATIINTRNIPGATHYDICSKCSGPQKNQPLIGLTTMTGLTADPSQENSFVGGVILDPKSGQHYHARARLMSNGKHLVIHGRLEGSSLGRNVTWVKN
ncbi:MAG: DUF2147 domain-containing protein [Acinetobacter gandensis]|uniref:DUF2147 domain-containing protein n=1 Tax=Acinetobacter gandensis TaxID=1443941 RepID=UPI00259AE635|nr:DUF2147 domain-containing protein [uncultured Acinetobacter sp.]